MKKSLLLLLLTVVALSFTSCGDHDNPELAPIDTSKVKITANVDVSPSVNWLNPTEEITVTVTDVEISAPKGVVLRNINLMIDGGLMLQKPYSGEALEFKLPLRNVPLGRINIAVWGDLIQKNCRDAQIIIADNIQHVIFSETPEFKCEAAVDVTVAATLPSGEAYTHTFHAESDGETLKIPADELYLPADQASTLDVTMSATARAYSTNSTLKADISRLYWSGTEGSTTTIKFSMPNTRGYLNTWDMGSRQIMLVVRATLSGTWENVTVAPSDATYFFVPKEY